MLYLEGDQGDKIPFSSHIRGISLSARVIISDIYLAEVIFG